MSPPLLDWRGVPDLPHLPLYRNLLPAQKIFWEHILSKKNAQIWPDFGLTWLDMWPNFCQIPKKNGPDGKLVSTLALSQTTTPIDAQVNTCPPYDHPPTGHSNGGCWIVSPENPQRVHFDRLKSQKSSGYWLGGTGEATAAQRRAEALWLTQAVLADPPPPPGMSQALGGGRAPGSCCLPGCHWIYRRLPPLFPRRGGNFLYR